MSTTTGADTALDLDAIEARANAATEGPWEADSTTVSQHWSRPQPWSDVVSDEVSCMAYCYGGTARAIEREADVEFIAHARTDIPALVAEVRRLRPRVISGDVGSVTAALDGLPVGSIIACDERGEDMVYHSYRTASGRIGWKGEFRPVDSAHIARHQVPITVLREGTGA